MDRCKDFDTGDQNSPDTFKLAARIQFQNVSNIQIILNEHVGWQSFHSKQLLELMYALFLLLLFIIIPSWGQSPRRRPFSLPSHPLKKNASTTV